MTVLKFGKNIYIFGPDKHMALAGKLWQKSFSYRFFKQWAGFFLLVATSPRNIIFPY